MGIYVQNFLVRPRERSFREEKRWVSQLGLGPSNWKRRDKQGKKGLLQARAADNYIPEGVAQRLHVGEPVRGGGSKLGSLL